MLRLALVLALIAVAAASVPYIKTKEEIQAFKDFLDRSQAVQTDELARFFQSVNPKANIEENSGKFEGDILLTDRQKDILLGNFATGARNGVRIAELLWPNNEIVYEIVEEHFEPEHIEAIEVGLKDLATVSCVTFKKKTDEDEHYVRITGLGGGCYAHVGYQRMGAQSLNLAPSEVGVGCFRHGTIVHEVLHAIGFLHMQSTHNRDDWVDIIWDNINPGNANNFYIYDSETVSNFGTDYDYGSCLHYSEYGFSINGERTIVPIQPYDGLIGQRVGLSPLDIAKLNRIANCPGHDSGWEHN